MASIFLALRNPEKLKTRFPGSLRLGRPPVELRAETSATLTFVLPSTVLFDLRCCLLSVLSPGLQLRFALGEQRGMAYRRALQYEYTTESTST